jgi:hypothetical protein
MTMPETAMPCADFEEYLTDYLDGFCLPSFHRWERHAVLCNSCTDPREWSCGRLEVLTYKTEGFRFRTAYDRIPIDAWNVESDRIKASWTAALASGSAVAPDSGSPTRPVAMMFSGVPGL